jgi:signal transduction histidine kinase/DNA-binding response OmpR family regulator
MKNLKISTKIYLGFGCVLLLALIVAGVGLLGLNSAEGTFAEYRQLARQTNADGRVQANMLTTRIFAKNFVIDANRENIVGVQNRARKTLELIRENKELGGADTGRRILLSDLEESLKRYVEKFEEVTGLQEERDELVSNKLNKLGPMIEKKLTAIMTSALQDGDAKAAYEAGITLRSLLLGRLYANRFLIENDDASRARAIREFRDLEFNYTRLASELDNPERKELADAVRVSQGEYLQAFDKVHQVIVKRNEIIQYELDRIGPDVANRIERLKLAIKKSQDILGPKAQADLNRSILISIFASAVVIGLGIMAAALIGTNITRPIASLTASARAMGRGDLNQDIAVDRDDEIGVLAKSLSAMRDSILDKVTILEQENAERRKAEKALEDTHANLEHLVEDRTSELAAARDEAEKATRVKAEFLAAMSHEIRTPMNGVIGMIDLLKQSKMSNDQHEMVETVRSSAYALLTIINDILDFSKIEAGKLELEAVPTSISDVVEGVTETLGPNARNKGIELISYVDPKIPIAVLGDSVRLRQILFNLGGNAIKFTEEGRVLIRVDQMPPEHPEAVTLKFQVIDSGIGISEEARSGLFDAFSQAEMSTTRKFGGTGLGLTISQRLVNIMEGSIGVESELGKGSCFSVTVTFPVSTDHRIASDGFDLEGVNVLMALRDPQLAEFLPSYLEHWGASVSVQGELDLIEAQLLAAQSSTPFDILFLEDEGFRIRTDTVRSIQSNDDLKNVKFVLPVNRRLAEREDLLDTVYTVLNPIKRSSFLRAVAAAAGLTSPDVEYNQDGEQSATIVEPLSPEDAEAAGQLILLAEDNLTNQKVIIRQLNSLGYSAIIADDGEIALRMLDERNIALLLTDCHMPNLDGFGLTAEVRSREQKQASGRIPIVAITASALTEEVQQCYDSGMDGFLPKPVEIAKLHTMLKKWMGSASNAPVTYSGKKNTSVEQLSKDGPFDLSFLEETFGDDRETIVEILKEFVDPSEVCCNEVEIAIQDDSLAGVVAGTHKLKSAARSVGAIELADICDKLESAGKNGDWIPVRTMAPELKSRLRDVTEFIARM